ncbi:MAG: hypothetical protein J6P05_04960 [Lachnospiraceae bacterium]|nr:hypothetical protein [Lachnospiraceae bacterium]
MICVYLEEKYERPAFNIMTESGADILCLFDTGAMISVWCQKKTLFLKHFPNAIKTNYVTTITGFGGKSVQKREIWRIPSFVIEDSHGNGQYKIENLLVALVDARAKRQFSLILCSPVFRGTSYHIFDIDSSNKHMEIHPKANRPAYCVPKEVIDRKIIEERMPSEFVLETDEIFIEGVTVFAGGYKRLRWINW